MPDRRLETSAQGKWNGIFRLNQANQEEWLSPSFIPFRMSYNGAANLTPTDQSGPNPEVVPNILV